MKSRVAALAPATSYRPCGSLATRLAARLARTSPGWHVAATTRSGFSLVKGAVAARRRARRAHHGARYGLGAIFEDFPFRHGRATASRPYAAHVDDTVHQIALALAKTLHEGSGEACHARVETLAKECAADGLTQVHVLMRV